MENMFSEENAAPSNNGSSAIVQAVKDIKKSIGDIKIPDNIEISNIDFVKKYLRDELAILAEKFGKIIKDLPAPIYKPTFSPELKTNYPDEMKVAEIKTLVEAVNDLRAIMAQVDFNPTIHVEAPKMPEIRLPKPERPIIEVQPPEINISPEIDLSGLLKALKPLMYLSDKPSKPLSVRMSDGERFIKALQDASKVIEKHSMQYVPGQGLTESEFTKQFRTVVRTTDDILNSYKVADVDDDATPNYYGFTDKDGLWYIMKEILSAGANTYRFIKGSTGYTTNWTGRAGLSYDYFYNIW